MYNRNYTQDIKAALSESPVVFINGARQVGKSTLVKILIDREIDPEWEDDNWWAGGSAQYVTLDDPTILSAALSSPLTFLENLIKDNSLVVIDEIQRVTEILLPIKKLVDEDRKPGRFLLTGSANVMAFPKLAESLAGRMETYTLWPLSQGEIEGRKERFIDACFTMESFPADPSNSWEGVMKRVIIGGYPEPLQRQESKRRDAWYASYIDAILQRDIRDLAQIEGHRELPNVLQLLAARIGGVLNFSDISRLSKIGNTTLKRYMALLEAVFLYAPLPAWFRNEEKRLVKSPKIYLNDTGLVTHLRGIDIERLVKDHNFGGGLLENFVVMELRKQQSWSDLRPKLYHFRTSAGKEVDVVMEARDGRLVGIEVKSKSEVNASDFNGLKALEEASAGNFVRGIVLYTGRESVSFGENLHAVPLSALWRTV